MELWPIALNLALVDAGSRLKTGKAGAPCPTSAGSQRFRRSRENRDITLSRKHEAKELHGMNVTCSWGPSTAGCTPEAWPWHPVPPTDNEVVT